jgi:hypothetical protein
VAYVTCFLFILFFRYHICITSKLWTHLEHVRTPVLLEWCRTIYKIFTLQITILDVTYSITREHYVQQTIPQCSEDRVRMFCHVLINNTSVSILIYRVHYMNLSTPPAWRLFTPLFLKTTVLNKSMYRVRQANFLWHFIFKKGS